MRGRSAALLRGRKLWFRRKRRRRKPLAANFDRQKKHLGWKTAGKLIVMKQMHQNPRMRWRRLRLVHTSRSETRLFHVGGPTSQTSLIQATGFLESSEGPKTTSNAQKVDQLQSFHFRSRSCTPPPGSTVNPACISLPPAPLPPPAPPTAPPLPPTRPRQALPRLGSPPLPVTPDAAPSVPSNPHCDCASVMDGAVFPSAPTAAAAAASFGGRSVAAVLAAAAAGEMSRAAQMRARSIRSATPANGRPTQPRGPDA